MRFATIAILIIGVVLFCAPLHGQTGSDSMPESEEQATLYFYRKPEFYDGRLAIWIGQTQLVNEFRASHYFWVNLPAGTYEIRTNGRPSWVISEKKYQLQVEAGQEYYIEAVLEYDFLGTALLLEERSLAEFNKRRSKLRLDERAIRSLE